MTSDAAALQPPAESILTLTAPGPVAAVATTQAPAMAPRVDEAMLPALDSKVSDYLSSLSSAATRSPVRCEG